MNSELTLAIVADLDAYKTAATRARIGDLLATAKPSEMKVSLGPTNRRRAAKETTH